MGSLTQPKLPVINIDDFKPDTESWVLECNKVRHILEEYGCFIAVYDRVSQELKREVLDSLKTLFDLSTETKMKNTSDKPLHGYLGPSCTRPLHESMGITNATSFDRVQSFANLMWPSGIDHFSKVMHSYANLVQELDNLVSKMVFISYGVEKYFESHIESMTYLLKVIKYRPAKEGETNLATAIHTDKNFLTILTQNQVNGLEVQIKDNEWVPVDFLPSSFIVMATDAFMAWSNGRLKSACHRVIMKGQEDRYSIALFSLKKGITDIPEEVIDEEHPRRFKPFDNFKYLDFYAKHPVYLDEREIKLFCGV